MQPVKQKTPSISEIIKIKAKESAPPRVFKEINEARCNAEKSTCVLALKHGPEKEIDIECFDAESRVVALWSAHELIRVSIKELKSDLIHKEGKDSYLVERNYASLFARMKGIRYNKDTSEFRDGFLAFESMAESAKQMGEVYTYEDALNELAKFIYSKIVCHEDGGMDAASMQIIEPDTSKPERMIRVKSYFDDSFSGSAAEIPQENEIDEWISNSQGRKFPDLPPLPIVENVTPAIRTVASSTEVVNVEPRVLNRRTGAKRKQVVPSAFLNGGADQTRNKLRRETGQYRASQKLAETKIAEYNANIFESEQKIAQLRARREPVLVMSPHGQRGGNNTGGTAKNERRRRGDFLENKVQLTLKRKNRTEPPGAASVGKKTDESISHDKAVKRQEDYDKKKALRDSLCAPLESGDKRLNLDYPHKKHSARDIVLYAKLFEDEMANSCDQTVLINTFRLFSVAYKEFVKGLNGSPQRRFTWVNRSNNFEKMDCEFRAISGGMPREGFGRYLTAIKEGAKDVETYMS
jgi:hypothetical protein